MFDVEKIRRMTETFQKLPADFDDIYLIPEIFTEQEVALFKRLNIKIRKIIFDAPAQKEVWGIPVVKTADVAETFNERTALIILLLKPVQLIETTFDLKVGDGIRKVPAFVISAEDVPTLYDNLMMEKFIQMYAEDSVVEPKKSVDKLNVRIARGITARLNPVVQSIKIDLWDRRRLFKPTYNFSDTAIVFQGPITYDNNYTVETFKLYRSIYPNVPIVVSTWKNEATNAFRKECRENSILLLENEPPESRGIGNVDMQLKSSLQGVNFIKAHTSAKFVLKTRTDQRINYLDFLIYFKNLLKTFPPNGDKLRERIIFLGSHDTKAYPFHPHDFLAFGHVEDICKLYDIPYHDNRYEVSYNLRHRKRNDKINSHVNSNRCSFDYNSVTAPSHKLVKLNRMMNRIYAPEMYMTRTFYEKYIAPVDPNKLYETSWKFTVDYLILVDFDTIQLDWPKYENMRYLSRFLYGNTFAFARWLDMYKNLKIDWI